MKRVFLNIFWSTALVCLGLAKLLGSDDTFDELYKMAAIAYGNNEDEESLRLLLKAEQIRPNQVITYALRGAIYSKRKEYKNAQATFQKALQIDPDSILARRNLAETYFEQQNFLDAKKGFDYLLTKHQDDKEIQFSSYLCSLMLQDTQASEGFLGALKKDKESPIFDYCHAAKEFKNGNKPKALEFVESAFRDYSPEKNTYFSYKFVQLGYLEGETLDPQPLKERSSHSPTNPQ